MNSERNLEKLSKAELINLVEKQQNKARKPKIAIVDNGDRQVPPRDPKPPKPNRPPPPPPMKEHITDVPSSKIMELH